MNCQLRVLAGERRQRFFAAIRQTYKLPASELVRVVRERGYTLRMRAAALRSLTCSAPIEVTLGRPYAESRRLVRAHYQV